MANLSAAGNSYRAARRSTRRDEAIMVTVSGVDARRGPYTEKVSTLTVSCHGCKYPSKYQVLPDALVTLELHPESNGSAKISTRGRVKWVQRDSETGQPSIHRRRVRKSAKYLEDPVAPRGLAPVR